MDRVFELFPRLYERRTQKAGTMSGGEQQMCAIGRALMARPKLLLLDEPSMGLAPIFVEKIFEIVIEINQQGTPVLLVEQNALMALDIANRGYVLETGRVALEGPAAELKVERAGPQDVPRRGAERSASGFSRGRRLRPTSSDDQRRIRRREQHPEPVAATGDAAGHLERGGDVVRRDEPERPRRPGIAAAGDEHAAGALEDGCARRPVDVGQQRMRGTARGGRRRAPRASAATGPRAAASCSSVAPSRSTWKRLRYGVCGPCPNVRRRSWRSTTVPPSRERRGVAPEAQRVAEADRGRGDRVQRLPRLVQRLPRERHDDRVERLVELRAAQRDPAEERLCVRDGGRPGEDGDGGELARERSGALGRAASREHVEEPPDRGAGERRDAPAATRGSRGSDRAGVGDRARSRRR